MSFSCAFFAFVLFIFGEMYLHKSEVKETESERRRELAQHFQCRQPKEG